MAGNFPSLNWNKDNFGDWLLYNGTSNFFKGVGGASLAVVGTIGLIASSGLGALVGFGAMALSGVMTLANSLIASQEHAEVPDTAKGTSNGQLNTANGTNTFYYYAMSVKYEFAKKIDDYFSMAGYKVNALKIPNIEGRTNWNFVKTLDCNIEGTEIPEKDIEELKKMFNMGITFWHNYSTFRDYSQSNSQNPLSNNP
jgi:hypothetical protein